MEPSYNAYKFTSLRAVREALRNYKALAQMDDPISVTIFLDLRRALGDDPEVPTLVVTKRQRLAIQLYLIENRKATDVARELRIHKRAMYTLVCGGLKRLLAYLQDGVEPDGWKPHEFVLLRDPDYTVGEIAEKLGKTPKSVERAMSRYRERERIPYRTRRRSRRNTSNES